MKQKLRWVLIGLFITTTLLFTGCAQQESGDSEKIKTREEQNKANKEESEASKTKVSESEEKQKKIEVKTSETPLPESIEWLTNDSDPVFASPEAQKGGTFRTAELSFPLTFRVVGPDSNSSYRGYILDNQLSLIGIHPNTENIIPEIATHWAYGDDKKTMYFKLNPKARWSDGHPVTADDFVYTLEFMRSKHIVAPWYNDYYTKEIEKVVVFDDHTLAVVGTKAQPDLHLKLGLGPTPHHYYKELDKDFVRTYNWKIVPNTGAYIISDFKKGRNLQFVRKKDWWAADLKYFRNRFNVDKLIVTVIRDVNMQWEHFIKGKIDTYPLTKPKYWHKKSHTSVFEQGYVDKIWFFTDSQQPSQGLWLNEDKDIFKDPNVRYAFAHGMNIQKVIDTVLRKDYYRLEHGYVGYGDYSNRTIKARRFDLNKVEAYMQKSGWQRGNDGIWTKNGGRFSVEVVYSQEDHTPRLVVLKEEAKRAGIELKLRRLDPASNYKKILEKKHDVAWSGWSTSLRPRFWSLFHSVNAHKPQTNNITNTDDPELDRFIDAYRDSLETEKRIVLAVRIQQMIHDHGMYVPTFMVPYVREGYWRWWRLPKTPGTRHSGSLFDPFGSTTGGLFWFDQKVHQETKTAMKKKQTFDPVTIEDKTYRTF